jgi:hypothetical protein
MCKKCLIALLAALAVLCSCGGGGGQREREDLPDLLAAVPSDALALCCSSTVEGALEPLDSADALRRLDLSAFVDSPAVLSLSYNGSLVSILAIGTGSAPEAPEISVRRGVQSRFFPPDAATGRQGVLALSASESQLVALSRHISEGRSIFDAPGFTEAAALTEGDNFTLYRNSGASHLIPKGFLGDMFPRRTLARFLHATADWTVILPDGDERIVKTSQGQEDTYFVNILASLPLADSRLGEILPDSTDFALSLPLPEGTFREAYERYVDASVRMTQYSKRLAALKTESGKDPLKWELELGIREIALVRHEGHTAVLLRPSRPLADCGVEDNPYRGFLQALYGDAFALRDDSCRGAVFGWYVIGSREDVSDFLSFREKRQDSVLPGDVCHFVCYSSGRLAVWDRKGIRIWNSSL